MKGTGTEDDQISPEVVNALRKHIEASGLTTDAFIAAYDSLKPEQIQAVLRSPFHPLYMRTTEASRRLVAALSSSDFMQAATGVTKADEAVAGELLGTLAEFANWNNRLTRRLEEIRRNHPAVWQAWEQAWRK